MFDSTSFQQSPKVTSSIKTKKELQSFYHYSKIVKLKETNHKPNQLSLNYTISQHNSGGVRQSDHISNFEYFINQNSRQNRHRQLKNQYQYHSQSALSKNSKDKTNWLKHVENQKRIEQSLNKQKFNHSLEHKEQSITRRRILRLSSESSVQSKFDLPQSRPTSKLAQHLQNEMVVASIHKNSSVKEISTQNHSKADLLEFDDYPNNQGEEDQEYNNEEHDEQEQEEEGKEEFQTTIQNVKSSMKLNTQEIQVTKKSSQKLDSEQVSKIKKQATIQLHQTKKKLKQQISSQITHQASQLNMKSQQTLQTQQSQLMQTQKTIDNQDSNRKGFNNEAYIKQILNEQLKYKQAQLQEQQVQQERLQKIKEIEEEIVRKKNRKEDFQYNPEEDLSEEAFIKQQQILKQQQLLKEEEERQLKLLQEEENKKQQKLNEEKKMKELEEAKKSEIAGIIKKQKTMLEEQDKIDNGTESKQSKLQKQKTFFSHQQSLFAQRKQSQEEIESSNREIKRQIDESIKKQKEEEEKQELEQLDFVDYMLRAKDIYEVDYEKFKLYSKTKLKKIKEPPKNIEDEDENIYYNLKKWKQISKMVSIKTFGQQFEEILQIKT